ncbi:protein quick-to-court isoform X2 [Diachasmimorpha longicaudata]
MVRQGLERSPSSSSLRSGSVTTPTSGIRALVTSPTSPTSPLSPGLNGTSKSAEFTSPTSPNDSRIPRPSPSALRRSASMRVRGERVYHHHTRIGTLGSSTIQGYQRHSGGLPQYQPDLFPAITENGVDSPRHRSLSLSLTPARPRPHHAADSTLTNDDSDLDSVKSYGSACSTASACDHAHFALNGTTWSGRSRKYVVHCSNQSGDGGEYLTPTQRAAKQIRRYQTLLNDAKKEIDEKDREIMRLTKELVELRLYKASLNSPDERTDSSDALTVKENNPFSPESPCKDLPEENGEKSPKSPVTPEKRVETDLTRSLADSGHFENESVHSKESSGRICQAERLKTVDDKREGNEEERKRIVGLYEGRIEEMHRRHVDEVQEIKQKHNEKVESLLNQLQDVNTRYCELRPSMDAALGRVKELEEELENTKTQLNEQMTLLNEQEERNKQMYLKMYAKGQEAARLEQADQIFEHAQQDPPKITVAELLQQLSVTQAELENIKGTSYLPQLHLSADRSQCLLSAQEAVSLWVLATRKAMYRRIVESRKKGTLDPEITLQFLKSAIYYFLTDKENHHGHLNAIESILGFSDNEKLNIDKIYRSTRK